MKTSHCIHPTRWTLVLRARGEGGEAEAALSELCAAYYEPVVAFLRRDGRGDDAARELAHAFFENVLSGGVGAPEPERGRFRNYLLGSLKHFLSKRKESEKAAKRGGGEQTVELMDDSAISSDDARAFDREWALAIIARALTTLEVEHAEKAILFATLKPWLGTADPGSQAEAAVVLGMSATAVKVAVHRLRVRFRELIRAGISATLDDPIDAADELRHLIVVATMSGGIAL